MNFSDFKKLQKKVAPKPFFDEFKTLDRFLHYFSFLGNIASIIFAFIFLYSIFIPLNLTQYLLIAISIASVLLLVTLEGVKRISFGTFVLNIFRNKTVFNLKSFIGITFTVLVISASFYLSLNGAKQLFDKDRLIKQPIMALQDSLINTQTSRHSKLEETLIKSIENKELEIDMLNKRRDSLGFEYLSDKKYRSQIQKELSNLNQQLIDISDKLDEREDNIDEKIIKESAEIEAKIDKSSNYLYIISIIIEFIILIGVFYHNYYENTSYLVYKDSMTNNDNFLKFKRALKILDYIYNSGKVKKGERIRDLSSSTKPEYKNALDNKGQLNLLANLEILSVQTPHVALVNYEQAIKILEKDMFTKENYFKI